MMFITVFMRKFTNVTAAAILSKNKHCHKLFNVITSTSNVKVRQCKLLIFVMFAKGSFYEL